MLDFFRWAWALAKRFWRGLIALVGGLATVAAFANNLRTIWKAVQDILTFQWVIDLIDWIAAISLAEAVLLFGALCLTSLLVAVFHTAPRKKVKEEFEAELEKRRPGVTKRKGKRRQ